MEARSIDPYGGDPHVMHTRVKKGGGGSGGVDREAVGTQ